MYSLRGPHLSGVNRVTCVIESSKRRHSPFSNKRRMARMRKKSVDIRNLVFIQCA